MTEENKRAKISKLLMQANDIAVEIEKLKQPEKKQVKPIALREEWRDKMRSQIKLSEDELELFKCQVYDALFNDYNCPSWEQDHQQ